MVPEITSATDRIFCHLGPFFAKSEKSKFWKEQKNTWRYYRFPHVYHKWQSRDIWFLRYGAWQTEFFVILDFFLPFYTPNNPKNQNFEKLKKMPWDIIILNMCTINDNHMMYGSWDIEHDTPNLWYFGPSFALLPP